MSKKIIVLCMLLATVAFSANAKIKLGLRAGSNITELSFNKDVLKAENRTGFFIGLTTKIDLPLGFDIDASALYNQIEANSGIYVAPDLFLDDNYVDTEPANMKRKSFAVPLNFRKGFGFGDKFDVFLFAGPQFDFNIGGDSKIGDIDWQWESSALSINIGAGLMLFNHVEVKANYNVPCGKTGEFDRQEIKDHITAKTGGWQVGFAYYF